MKNVINWFNLPSKDFDRAIKFYSAVLEIEMMRMPSPDGFENAFFSNPQEGGVSGSIGSNPQQKPGMDGTTIYFDVNGRLDAVLTRVSENGGQIVMPKMNIGDFGNIALAMDSEGNLVGFHSAS
ncbi:VOC family protein [Spongiimicrobium sp. 3-5]|uniref:VOC family protein n=1 Tax=Spongiimicrobium sp. 3-5 TaxID=3332596 RepID=UPI00397FDA10